MTFVRKRSSFPKLTSNFATLIVVSRSLRFDWLPRGEFVKFVHAQFRGEKTKQKKQRELLRNGDISVKFEVTNSILVIKLRAFLCVWKRFYRLTLEDIFTVKRKTKMNPTIHTTDLDRSKIDPSWIEMGNWNNFKMLGRKMISRSRNARDKTFSILLGRRWRCFCFMFGELKIVGLNYFPRLTKHVYGRMPHQTQFVLNLDALT